MSAVFAISSHLGVEFRFFAFEDSPSSKNIGALLFGRLLFGSSPSPCAIAVFQCALAFQCTVLTPDSQLTKGRGCDDLSELVHFKKRKPKPDSKNANSEKVE